MCIRDSYVSGLASGMDTESIVKSLLMGTQTKIDKQSGLKQQLEWKQDIYRDLITKINTFSDKYFSYYGSGDTNLMSQSLFKTMTGISSSGAIKISSVSSNAVSSMNISEIDVYKRQVWSIPSTTWVLPLRTSLPQNPVSAT